MRRFCTITYLRLWRPGNREATGLTNVFSLRQQNVDCTHFAQNCQDSCSTSECFEIYLDTVWKFALVFSTNPAARTHRFILCFLIFPALPVVTRIQGKTQPNIIVVHRPTSANPSSVAPVSCTRM